MDKKEIIEKIVLDSLNQYTFEVPRDEYGIISEEITIKIIEALSTVDETQIKGGCTGYINDTRTTGALCLNCGQSAFNHFLPTQRSLTALESEVLYKTFKKSLTKEPKHINRLPKVDETQTATKEHPKSNDELLKMAKKKVIKNTQWLDFDEFLEYADYKDTKKMYDNLAIEYSSLVNQEDAVKFAEWIPMNAVIAQDGYYYISLKDLSPITADELYQLYQEYLNKICSLHNYFLTLHLNNYQ